MDGSSWLGARVIFITGSPKTLVSCGDQKMAGQYRVGLFRLKSKTILRYLCGKKDLKGGSSFEFAVNGHEAAMASYESKACAGADFFAFKERTKDIIDHRAGRAAARVAHAKHDVSAKLRSDCHRGVVLVDLAIAHPDQEQTALGHGVARIEEKVVENSMQLQTIAFD
jgi:hypothetical protein